MANNLTFIGMISALVILGATIVMLSIQLGVNDVFDWKLFLTRLMDAITLTVILVIVAIPEGLPMVVTVSIAFCVKRMVENDGVLIKDTVKTEVLGQVSEVCVRKTGILTTEDMVVDRFYMQSTDHPNSRKDTLLNCTLAQDQTDLLAKSIIFNSTVYIEMTRDSLYEPLGNSTEVSLFKWLQGADIPVHKLIQEKGHQLLHMPFDPKYARSVTAIKSDFHNSPNQVRIYVKGEPESVINACTHVHGHMGEVTRFDDGQGTDQAYLTNTILTKSYCRKHGLRSIAFAYRDMGLEQFEEIMAKDSYELNMEQFSSNLTFLALVGLKDPVRQNTSKLVKFVGGDVDLNALDDLSQQIKNVTVRIVSGDHLDTVRHVAKESGLIGKEEEEGAERVNEVSEAMGNAPQVNNLCMTAEEFFNQCGKCVLDNETGKYNPGSISEFRTLMQTENPLSTLRVIARAKPMHKEAIINGLRELETKVIAVGSGLTDIKVMEAADVSFSMGGGCALTRAKSTMVLVNDEFKALAKSILWGRNIYVNVKRFLTFQLTCNFSALLTVFIGQFFLAESPLNAIQLLWVNLIMDILAALALATTPPFTKVMKQGIYQNDLVLNKIDWRNIITMTAWTVIIMCVVIFGGSGIWDIPYKVTDQITDNTTGGLNKKIHMTLIFNTYVYLLFFNMINCRVVGAQDFNVFDKFFGNFIQVIILLVIFGFQWFSNTSFLNWLFATTTLTQKQFWSTVVLGATALLFSFLVKLTPRRWAETYIKAPIDETKDISEGRALMQVHHLSQKRMSVNITKGKDGKSTLIDEANREVSDSYSSPNRSDLSGRNSELDDPEN